MLIFFISPHPDDMEYGCGGIIKKSYDAGHCLHCFVNIYSANKNDEFFNHTRLEEAMTLEDLGCKVHFWNNNEVNKMIEWICDLKPDVIIMPYHRDHNETHRQVNENVEIAIERARFGFENKEGFYTPCILYYETFSTFEFVPDIVIDVTSEYTIALKQLKMHRLGIQMLPSLPYVFQISHQNRGVQGSCLYGEGLIINKKNNCLWTHNTRKLLQYLISITQKGADDE